MSTQLAGLQGTLRFKAEMLIRLAEEKGIKIIITQGLRTIEYQNSLYAQGRTTKGSVVTNARGGYSYHNFGLAFDFAILNPNGKTVNWNTSIDLNKDGQKDWYQVAELAQSLGLEAGAFWKSFLDVPHCQLTFGLTTAQLRAGRKPPYISDSSVKNFQETLNKLGAKLATDGLYGDGTIQAVKDFQGKHGLKVDGFIGTTTWNKIQDELKPTPKPKPKPVVVTVSSTKKNDKEEIYLEMNPTFKKEWIQLLEQAMAGDKPSISSNGWLNKVKEERLTQDEAINLLASLLNRNYDNIKK